MDKISWISRVVASADRQERREHEFDSGRAPFETSLQLHDEIRLKAMLDSLLECDESNLRVLRILMTLVLRQSDWLTPPLGKTLLPRYRIE